MMPLPYSNRTFLEASCYAERGAWSQRDASPIRKSSRFERRESCMQATRRSEFHLLWSEDRPKQGLMAEMRGSITKTLGYSVDRVFLERQMAGRNCDQLRRSRLIILLGSSCRAICLCLRRKLILQNPDSTDHRAAAETDIQMGRTDRFGTVTAAKIGVRPH